MLGISSGGNCMYELYHCISGRIRYITRVLRYSYHLPRTLPLEVLQADPTVTWSTFLANLVSQSIQFDKYYSPLFVIATVTCSNKSFNPAQVQSLVLLAMD
jgi:hypothetical protein